MTSEKWVVYTKNNKNTEKLHGKASNETDEPWQFYQSTFAKPSLSKIFLKQSNAKSINQERLIKHENHKYN